MTRKYNRKDSCLMHNDSFISFHRYDFQLMLTQRPQLLTLAPYINLTLYHPLVKLNNMVTSDALAIEH